MTKKEQFVKELRELANFVEGSEFGDDFKVSNQTFHLFCHSKDEFKKRVKALGNFEKSADLWLNATKRFGDFISFQVTIMRDIVCKKVKVGTKIVPAQEEKVIPEQIIPAKPESVEDVYEYKCPESFLDLEEDEVLNENS